MIPKASRWLKTTRDRVRIFYHPCFPLATTSPLQEQLSLQRGNPELPSPADVRRAAGSEKNRNTPAPVVFPSLHLIVKYGLAIRVAEGQCLWAIRHLLPTVPVPEVYGWCQDNGQTFIYMQLVDGTTLEEGWPDLDMEEKYGICMQLHYMLENLRQLRQDSTALFIGDINQGPLHDVIFDYRQPAGPFSDVASFHEWFANLSRHTPHDLNAAPRPWRSGLLDDVPIVLTHGDLHRSNIMMSRDENGVPHVVAIIDWHQSGWYPASWEFYKTRYTCKGDEVWEIDFILEWLQAYRGYISWGYFVLALGV